MDRNKFNNNTNIKYSFNHHKDYTSSNQPHREFGKINNRRQYATYLIRIICFLFVSNNIFKKDLLFMFCNDIRYLLSPTLL